MPAQTPIEWTEITWNPVTGCTKISAGCKHCYAERMAKRLKAMGSPRYFNGFQVTLHPDLLDYPRRLKSPRTIFVNSMSDLFHESVAAEFIFRVFETMNACPQHIFQVLTKRSARLKNIARALPWSENIWMGVSVEDEHAIHRMHDLITTPSPVHFLSCEPLIGPLHHLPISNIQWVIVGGNPVQTPVR